MKLRSKLIRSKKLKRRIKLPVATTRFDPQRVDPSQTGDLRRRFARDLVRRFSQLLVDVTRLVVEEDAFGLRPSPNPLTENERLGSPIITNCVISNGICVNCGGKGSGKPGPCPTGRKEEVSQAESRAKQGVADLLKRYPKLSIVPPVHIEIIEGASFRPHNAIGLARPDLPSTGAYVHGAGIIRLASGLSTEGHARIGGDIVGGDAHTMLRHEFGHHVQDHIRIPVDEHGKRLSWQNISREFVGADKPTLVSGYAKENHREMYAESFAVYTQIGYKKGTLPKPIEHYFDTVLGKEVTGNLVANTRWAFLPLPQRIEAFKAWLATRYQDLLLGKEDVELWNRYVREGVQKGAGRAFDQVNRADAAMAKALDHPMDFYNGTRRQFLQSTFTRPVAIEKVQLLAGRTYSDIVGVTEAMSTQLGRTLADALSQGMNPKEAARQLTNDITNIGKTRAIAIAQTEIIRAHAEGQLMAMDDMGVEEVGVAVEWATARKGVCKQCSMLNGIVLKIQEATGLIPRHVSCRCAWIPANVGEKAKGQLRSKAEIKAAMSSSQKISPESDSWGEGKGIDKKRPEPLIKNTELGLFSVLLANCGGKGSGKPGPCPTGVHDPKVKFKGKPVGAAEHAEADKTSHQIASMVRGQTEEHTGGPGQKDKKPYDVRTPRLNRPGFHDIEVKTLLKRTGNKISVHEDALLRKVDHIKLNPTHDFHTVVVDKRDTFSGGMFRGEFSGHRLYYKRGSGRYTLEGMHPVKDGGELRKLLDTPTKQLPKKAQGKLPPPPPPAKLEAAAKAASESRKVRDKARKLANADKLREQARLRRELAKGS